MQVVQLLLQQILVLGALLLHVELHLLALVVHQLLVALKNVHLVGAQDRHSLFLVNVEFLKLVMEDSGVLLLTLSGGRLVQIVLVHLALPIALGLTLAVLFGLLVALGVMEQIIVLFLHVGVQVDLMIVLRRRLIPIFVRASLVFEVYV